MTGERKAGGGSIGDGLPLDDFLPYLLNRIAYRLNNDLSEDLRAIGMTLPHWRVLAVLKARDGRNIGELAVYTVIDQSTLSRTIDRMQRVGLVRRRASRGDARIKEVFITARGEAAFARILPLAMKHYRRAIAGLDEAERRALVGSLHKVLENIRRSPYP